MIKISPWTDGMTTIAVHCNCCDLVMTSLDARTIAEAQKKYKEYKQEGKENIACYKCEKRVLNGSHIKGINQNKVAH